MDLDMPGGDGITATRRSSRRCPTRACSSSRCTRRRRSCSPCSTPARAATSRKGPRNASWPTRFASSRRATSTSPGRRARTRGLDVSRRLHERTDAPCPLERLSHREQDVVILTAKGSTAGDRAAARYHRQDGRHVQAAHRGKDRSVTPIRVRALRPRGRAARRAGLAGEVAALFLAPRAHRPPLPDSGRATARSCGHHPRPSEVSHELHERMRPGT
jgi:hypothetical protein